ncbi:MAG: hypothetical protein HY549_10375 [Elusimicrobia bacterium]|nr:hypothetical protein [Elusimicrobiota bacterium]
MLRKPLAIPLAFSLLAASPGPAAYAAASKALRAGNSSAGWAAVSRELLPLLQSRPLLDDRGARLAAVLGDIAAADSLGRNIEPMLAFEHHLGSHFKDHPESFQALDEAAQIEKLAEAVFEASTALEGEGSSLIGQLGPETSPRDLGRLDEILAARAYLSRPFLTHLSSSLAEFRATKLGRELDRTRRLLEGEEKRASQAEAMRAEIELLKDGAWKLAQAGREGRNAWAGGLVFERYFRSAEARLERLGATPESLAGIVLKDYRGIISSFGPKRFIPALGGRREWTDMAAALAATTGARLLALLPEGQARMALGVAAGIPHFSIRLAPEHPLSGEHARVSDWFQSFASPAQPSPGLSLLGFPLTTHWSFALPAFLSINLFTAQFRGLPGAGLHGLLLSGGILASLLAHELAHAVTLRRRGVPVDSISLSGIGAIAHIGRQPPSPRSEAPMRARFRGLSQFGTISFTNSANPTPPGR